MKRFRIAFSFAAEKRDFVVKVADLLAAHFGRDHILYDKYHEAEFARHDLGIYLPKLYGEESELIVPVLCANYDRKLWTGWEWVHIYGLLTKADSKRVMPCRFDFASADGLSPAAGFIELDSKTWEETAILILERLALNEGNPRTHYLLSTGSSVGLCEPSFVCNLDPHQEKRVRDFAKIVAKTLVEFKISVSQDTPEFCCLKEMTSGLKSCTADNLRIIGSWLWRLVCEKKSNRDNKDDFDGFWDKLVADLHRRFPRANSTKQWVELQDALNHYNFDEPKWNDFLDHWVHPLFPVQLDLETIAALEPYRRRVISLFSDISLSGFGGPAAQSEAEGKAELSKVYIDLDIISEPDARSRLLAAIR